MTQLLRVQNFNVSSDGIGAGEHQSLESPFGLDPGEIEAVCFGGLISPSYTQESFRAFFEANADLPPGGSRAERLRRGAVVAASAVTPLRRALDKRRVTTFDVTPELARHGLAAKRLVRAHHHFNHGATAYFGLREDPDEPYLVLSLDGAGDGDCAHVYTAAAGRLELVSRTAEEHSPGALQTADGLFATDRAPFAFTWF